MGSKDIVTISIPLPLYKRIERLIEKTGYNNVEEFIVNVLREFLSEYESDFNAEEEVSEEEKKEIVERLKKLGYL